jgi:hypothetical protein
VVVRLAGWLAGWLAQCSKEGLALPAVLQLLYALGFAPSADYNHLVGPRLTVHCQN